MSWLPSGRDGRRSSRPSAASPESKMPDWNEPIRQQVADLNLAPAREAEIIEELAQHAEDRYRELQSGGATDEEARRIALDELGGHQLLASELRAIERTDATEPVVFGGKGKACLLYTSDAA